MYFILSTVKCIDADELEQYIKQLFRDYEIIYSAEKLIASGIEKDRIEGILEEKRKCKLEDANHKHFLQETIVKK